MPANQSQSSHHHRAGALKQSNKKNKRSKSSKRSLSRLAGGKVAGSSSSSGKSASLLERQLQQSKADRRNRQDQIRRHKKQELLRQRRGLVGGGTTTTATTLSSWPLPLSVSCPPPRVVGIISLAASSSSSSSMHLEERLRQFLVQGADHVVQPHSTTSSSNSDEYAAPATTLTAKYNVHKKNGLLTILTCQTAFASHYCNDSKSDHVHQAHPETTTTTSNHHNHHHHHNNPSGMILAALDLARIADLLVFVVDGNGPVGESSSAGGRMQGTDPILDMHIGDRSTTAGSTTTRGGKRGIAASSTTSTFMPQQKWDSLISTQGDAILTALKAQGLPTTLTVLAHTTSENSDRNANDDNNPIADDHMTLNTTTSVKSIRRARVKRRLDLKKFVHRLATTEFGSGNDKVVEVDLSLMVATNGDVTATKKKTTNDPDDNDNMEQEDIEYQDSSLQQQQQQQQQQQPPATLNSLPSQSGGSLVGTHPPSTTTVAALSSSSLWTTLTTSPHALIRTLCTMSCAPSKWVADTPRSYLLSEQYHYNATQQQLSICGYLRGRAPLRIHSLMHVPNLGTLAPVSVTRLNVPPILEREHATRRSKNHGNSTITARMEHDGTMDDGQQQDTLLADPNQQESLNMFATPDALAGEQNLIGFDEGDDEDIMEEVVGDKEEDNKARKNDNQTVGMVRPAGWSDYQSAWLDAVEDDDDDDENNDNTNDKDRGELADELNRKKSDVATTGGSLVPNDSEMLDLDNQDDDDDDDDDNKISATERQMLLDQRQQQRRQKEQKEQQEFPDEMQLKQDEKALERLARYRSLKSFKKSPWDPKENLPESYATVYHFSNFKATQRSVLKDWNETVRAADAAQGNFGFGSSSPQPQPNEKVGTTTATSNGGGGGGDDQVMAENSDNGDDNNVDDEDDEDESLDPLDGCVPSGTYVKLTLGGVSEESFRSLAPRALLSAVSLLEHENKVSVLHMGLCQSSKMMSLASSSTLSNDHHHDGGDHTWHEEGDPVPDHKVPRIIIKSKDVLTFRCGWRTWQGRPVFSQNNLNCNKHKFERFLPTGGAFFAASVFGPVTYTPCPVLVFRQHHHHHHGQPPQPQQQPPPPLPQLQQGCESQLVAAGTLMNADADRIVVKRVVLTGYPVRVHKRHATVKYMFYNPDDVKWFKPAELHTKHGLRGNIVQSVGEHGTMKCLFNAPIKQHDTVCLPLYKRVYPKYVVVNNNNNHTTRDASTTNGGDGGVGRGDEKTIQSAVGPCLTVR